MIKTFLTKVLLTLISFLHFSSWFLKNESILVGMNVANSCA
jgi:hypothetical protein